MQKISSLTDTADSNGEFTEGNVAGGVSPTILPAEWFNTIQRELVNLIQGSGLTLDPSNYSQVLAAIQNLYPTGIPYPWPTSTPPSGWIAMTGQTISVSLYPVLYAIYGGTLPDMRGYFIRGWAGSQTAIDSGRALLSKETGSGIAVQLGGFSGYNGIDVENAETGNVHSTYAVYSVTATQNSTGVTYKKIRPDNIAFNYIVRAA